MLLNAFLNATHSDKVKLIAWFAWFPVPIQHFISFIRLFLASLSGYLFCIKPAALLLKKFPFSSVGMIRFLLLSSPFNPWSWDEMLVLTKSTCFHMPCLCFCYDMPLKFWLLWGGKKTKQNWYWKIFDANCLQRKLNKNDIIEFCVNAWSTALLGEHFFVEFVNS